MTSCCSSASAQAIPLLPGLHGLRAIAASTVVLFHLHHITGLGLPAALSFVGTHFGMGVQLFFVLSTFSLFYSTAHTVSREGWAERYFVKRYFRIAPLFYFMLIAWIVLLSSRGVDLSSSEILLNILLVFNFVPGKHESIVQAGWTVGVEVIMYALLPLLFLTIRRLSHALLFVCIAIAISLVVRQQLNLAGGVLQKYSYFSFASSLGSFALGILAFKIFDFGRGASSVRRRLIYFSGLALVVLLFGTLILEAYNVTAELEPTAVGLVWCMLFAVIVYIQAMGPAPLLSSGVLVFLGERSYGLYLTHPMVIFWLGPLNIWLYSHAEPLLGAWAFVPCGVLTLGASICSSIVVYKLIERPGMQLGQTISGRPKARQF